MQNIMKIVGQFTSNLTLNDFCGVCTDALISTLFYLVNVTETHMMLVIGGKNLIFFYGFLVI